MIRRDRLPAGIGVMITLVIVVAIAAWRYDGFVGAYNIYTVLRYSSMFALVALGMCFVIMTGGIDLSVGTVAALASVVAARMSDHSLIAGVAAGFGVGLLAGVLNGLLITRARIMPFIATLATMLAAKGTALLIAGNQTVSASYDTGFTDVGQGDLLAALTPAWATADDANLIGRIIAFVLGMPTPAWIALVAYIAGALVHSSTAFGRHVLAIGGGREASRLMGLPVDRTGFWVYVISGGCAGLAGVILASQFGAGQPIEGVGWELFAIASVVVGGTLLSGGQGSIGGTLAGALLLGILYTILNFENGMGFVSLSAYWQSVVRGLFLMIVVIIQARVKKAEA